ncbi:MarR family transcriptional regulator [Microbacterium schleiferi]|uniref:MarR family transcriptional regulator n=1 Tax=Microbacterium schleiferi TaxID=69362 RepID=A0A7S8MYG0_9MICO|nr:MarR family transcriptional regulator [Microbacterium schleiferi]QPE05547.1 MarR family transcriptional regulator [Microbacterium schleiferi]
MTETAASVEDAVCFAVYSAAQATVQLYRELLAPWGVTYQQLLVLSILWREGSTSPSRIAAELHLDASTITGILNRLETAGLIERTRPAGDRRAVAVTATEASDDLRASLHRVVGCVADAMNLEPDAARSLIDTLHGLRESMTSADRPSLRSA